MMKMLLMFKRKPGMTAEQFREYYETRHVPLALRLFPYFKGYRRNYVCTDETFNLAGKLIPVPTYDVVTELTFESRVEFERMVRALEDPDVAKQIVDDEECFMDRSASVAFLVDEAVTPPERLRKLA